MIGGWKRHTDSEFYSPICKIFGAIRSSLRKIYDNKHHHKAHHSGEEKVMLHSFCTINDSYVMRKNVQNLYKDIFLLSFNKRRNSTFAQYLQVFASANHKIISSNEKACYFVSWLKIHFYSISEPYAYLIKFTWYTYFVSLGMIVMNALFSLMYMVSEDNYKQFIKTCVY